MKQRSRFGLLQQLLTGFGVGSLFVIALVLVGNRMLEQISSHVVSAFEQHVQPLARMHHLESQLASLRAQELELGGLHDVFVVQSHAVQIKATIDKVNSEVESFSRHLAGNSPQEAERLRAHWTDYRERLETLVQLASQMDMTGISIALNSGSRLPYTAIRNLLGEVADTTELAANTAYKDTLAAQDKQRRFFLGLMLFGGILLIISLALAGQTVVKRIRALHGHARELAAGRDSGAIDVGRHDEVGDLAIAFKQMREQVGSREAALNEARLDLEARVVARTLDLTRANQRLQLFSQLVEQSPLGILVVSLDGMIEYANVAHEKLTGLNSHKITGTRLFDVMAYGESIELADAISRALAQGAGWDTERRCHRVDGSTYWERLRLTVVDDQAGTPSHLVISREDITDRHDQQARIAQQANFDALTGLPNRALSQDRLVQATQRSRREHTLACVMFIDLDNFKQINDTLGHAAGDALLIQAAKRLKNAVREEDTVGRLGGDEFLIILSDLHHREDIEPIAEKILAAFTPPFAIDERELMSTPSIGVAIYPDDGTDPAILLRNADLAMYEAKEAGRNTYRHFNQATHDTSVKRLEIGRHLRGALSHDELFIVYHPLVEAATGQVIGAEALIRWKHPELGIVPPDVFIPIAEQNGQIVSVGLWVLQTACAQLAKWSQLHPGFTMAVNVSPRQFRAEGFIDSVRQCLETHALRPLQLEIEITEGLLLRNQGEVKVLIEQLRDLGVKLSMDDFGTGYSSLSYLREFPFHTIKIDRSFIRDLVHDKSNRALIVATVRMAQAMGLQIIAEGVEDDDQWMFLAAQECDILQGFRFGKPLPPEEFEARWINAEITPPTIEGLPLWSRN